MSAAERAFRHVYGPVPSRRLGRSIDVDPAIHLNEALKALDHLAVAGTVKTVASADRTFYIVTKRGANAGSPEGGPGR